MATRGIPYVSDNAKWEELLYVFRLCWQDLPLVVLKKKMEEEYGFRAT